MSFRDYLAQQQKRIDGELDRLVPAESVAPATIHRAMLVAELSMASGTVGGMIGGQVADLEGEGRAADAALLESIHRAKTGALLRASVRMGGIYAGASDGQLAALSAYGEHVGLAF